MFSREQDRPVGVVVLRACVAVMAMVLIPPFVVLAIAPMLLLLLPVAFVVLPFMLCAFAGEAGEVPSVSRLRSLRPAHASAGVIYPRLVRSLPPSAPSIRPVPMRSGPVPIAAPQPDSRRFAKDR